MSCSTTSCPLTTRWLCFIALLTTIGLLAPQAALGQNIQLSAGPIYPGVFVVGQTGVPVQYSITNSASSETIRIDFGAGDVIRYVPACGNSFFPCVLAQQDNAVFTPSATGTGSSSLGAANPTCNGKTFNFSPTGDPSQPIGIVTSDAASLLLAVGETCTIAFTLDVNSLPTHDAIAGGAVQTVGTGFASARGNVTPDLFGSGTGSSITTVLGCSAEVDKQISCDGGATFYDVATADDPNNAATLGCTANSGAPVDIQYVVTNTGGAAINCTLGDNVYPVSGGGAVILPGGVGQNQTFSTENPVTCDLTDGQTGENTATLAQCTCQTPTGDVPGTGDSDTAVHACCGVQIDKQVSCDDGATYSDTGYVSNNDDGTNGCISHTGANDIKFQWLATNTGNVPVTCDLDESNLVLEVGADIAGVGVPFGGNLIHGSTTDELECKTTWDGGEPNTARLINCECGGGLPQPPDPVTASDTATFECCGAKIDKIISCNGTPGDSNGFVDSNEDGTGDCTGDVGDPVLITYQVQNTGTVPIDCTIQDVNGGGQIHAGPGGNGILPGETGPLETNTQVTQCSLTLDTNEPNTATADCTCNGGDLGSPTDAAFDSAEINCAGRVTVEKTCENQGGNNFLVTVTVTNQTDQSVSCDLTDEYFPGACPPVGDPGVGTGTAVPMTPDPLLVAASVPPCTVGVDCTTAQSTGNFISNDLVCNRVTADCTASGGQLLPRVQDDAPCEPTGGGCFSRTPGFWGTHPAATQSVLDEVGGIMVCGVLLNNTSNAVPGSAIEDICVDGGEACKNQVQVTSMPQLQIIRQCTAAALNIYASRAAGLDCFGELENLQGMFNTCCIGADPVCNTDASVQEIGASGCITFLDAFNNSFEETDFPAFVDRDPPSAEPETCQESHSNNWVNPGRDLGPKQGKGKKCEVTP